MLFKTYTITLIILLLACFLNAQDLSTDSKESAKPVMLFKKAQDLMLQDKRAEAQEILENLLQKFPNDFEIRGLYLEAIGTIVSDETYREKAIKALEFYKKVPLAERTENFYKRYRIILRDLKKLDEMNALKDEIIQKFPRSQLAGQIRVIEASNEKDIVKAAELFEALTKDFENSKKINELYELYFSTISKDLSKFDKYKVISIAGKYEKLQFNILTKDSEPTTPRVTQSKYLKTVLDISDKLRERFPTESLKFAKRGLVFFEQIEPDENVNVFKGFFRQAAFRSHLVLEDWENARKTGLEIIEWMENSAPAVGINEANFHKDYSLVLENLNEIPLAREHIFIASIMDNEFEKDWKEFDSKYPLSPNDKVIFEKSITAKFRKFVASREAFVKAELLKTKQNTAASDFRLKDLNGNEVSLEDYKGKVLIMNFWATWCRPCVGELELMKTAYKNYADNPKVAFAFVSTDQEKEKVSIVANKRGYKFPIFYSNKKLENDYKVTPIPRMFIIDPQSNIRFIKRGFNDNGYYLKELDWMIETSMK